MLAKRYTCVCVFGQRRFLCTLHPLIIRQNTSLSSLADDDEDDWITINDNGVESVTHMYTEALLVLLLLIHNVRSFPLQIWRTIDVFIFVLDDQWCMISVVEEEIARWRGGRERKRKKRREDNNDDAEHSPQSSFSLPLSPSIFLHFVWMNKRIDDRRECFFSSACRTSTQQEFSFFPIRKHCSQLKSRLYSSTRHIGVSVYRW